MYKFIGLFAISIIIITSSCQKKNELADITLYNALDSIFNAQVLVVDSYQISNVRRVTLFFHLQNLQDLAQLQQNYKIRITRSQVYPTVNFTFDKTTTSWQDLTSLPSGVEVTYNFYLTDILSENSRVLAQQTVVIP